MAESLIRGRYLLQRADRPDRRGLTGSWQQVSGGGGFLAGSAVATLLTSAMTRAETYRAELQ